MSVDGQKSHLFKLARYVDGRNRTVTCVCLRCTGLVCDSHYPLLLLITPGLMSVQLSRSCRGLKDECETVGNDLNRRKVVVLEKSFGPSPALSAQQWWGKVHFTYIQLELQFILVLMPVVFQWLEMLLFNVISIESVNKIAVDLVLHVCILERRF